MFLLETILHKDISQSRLLDIVRLKMAAWNYPLEAQLSWIDRNISSEDVHCILKNGSEEVAYLNLKDIVLSINGVEYSAYGIGNVCAKDKGCGYGRELMLKVNTFLKDKNRIGMLFCKDALIEFYSRYDWELVPNCIIPTDYNLNNINTMLYNTSDTLYKVEYSGVLF